MKHLLKLSLAIVSMIFIVLLHSCKKTPKESEPIADFDVAVCPAPCDVVFKNKSQNAVSYKWDFGDGFTSLDANPTHKYEKNSTYTVSLEVSNTAGTNIAKKVITLNDKPVFVDITPNDGLTAYYTFEKSTKNIIADNYHGVNNNITFDSITPSQKGYSALFDPTLFSRMSIALNPFFDSSSGSFCFWMRSFKDAPQAIIHGNSLADRSGFSLVLDKNIKYNQYIEYQLSWGKWEFGKTFENFNLNNILDGKWHFVAITIKPNEHRLYIDGDLVQNNSTTDGMLGTNINNGMVVGQFVSEADLLYLYQGNLDNLRLYRRAITESEVKQIFKSIQ